MADVKWIKIITGIFDDEKILLIESMPSADSIIVIWFKLLTLAGKQNNDGVFMMSNRIPYTDEMLASIFRRDVNTVRMALKVFEQFGMIEIINNVITIPNWNKHQTLDAYEKKKERDRLYQAERRAAQRALIAKSSDASSDTSPDPSSDVAVSDKEGDKEGDSITVSIDTVRQTQSVRRAVEAWNELKSYGIKEVIKLSSESKRYESLCARINQYGIEKVLEAIENIKHSDFLQGKSKKGWVITFDWFVLPNNFPKVLEGNYDNKEGGYGKKPHMLTKEENDARRNGTDWMMKYMKRPEPKTAGEDPAIRERAEKLQRELKGE